MFCKKGLPFLFLFSWLFVSCNSDSFPDHFSLLQEKCVCSSQVMPIPLLPPQDCKDEIDKYILITQEENLDPKYGDQTERVYIGIYFLMNYPLYMDANKKIFRTASFSHFIPTDWQTWLTKYPDQLFQQVLVNHLLHTVQKYHFTTHHASDIGAFFDGATQTINIAISDTWQPTQVTFYSALHEATTLLHEVWHARSLDHEVYCPEVVQSASECDKTMNGPHGVEAAYAWLVLQGHEIRQLTYAQALDLEVSWFKEMKMIYSLPEDVQNLKNQVLDIYQKNPGTLEQPNQGITNYLTQELIWEKEQLSPMGPRDFYTELTKICPLLSPNSSHLCQKYLDEFLTPLFFKKEDQKQLNLLLGSLFSSTLSLPEQGVLSLSSLSALFSKESENWYWFARYQDEPKRFFFNYSMDIWVQTTYRDYLLAYLIEQFQNSMLETPARHLLAIKTSLLSWALPFDHEDKTKYHTKEYVENIDRWQFLYLVAILHGNKISSIPFLSIQSQEAFEKELCETAHQLGKTPLPKTLLFLPTVACQDLHDLLQ